MKEKNIRLTIAYDGSLYHGWQRQENGLTIQGIIEEKIQTMLGQPVTLIGSGRTDAGVHALNQVANFRTRSLLGVDEIKRGLNSLLPDDIYVKNAEEVLLQFHARYDAKKKRYEYLILNREEPDIFKRNYVWHVRMPLNTHVMSECMAILVGQHDFSSFRSSGSGKSNPVRSLFISTLYGPADHGLLRIVIEADGFLRHMVRNIVGTVVEAGLGKISADEFRVILESKDRSLAGIKAPAQGLYLVKVEY
jgi:tRNA pseudouridine38-40 synthase